MRCVKPIYLSGVEVACGKCIACRKNYSQEWTTRIMQELDYYPYSTFLTLTYDDEHLPSNGSVSKEELQKFFKRVRKNYPDMKFKYFACGEYGEKSMRPHYHVIALGIPQNWVSLKITDPNNPQLVRCDEWTNGFVHVGTITRESTLYVTDYVLKKWSGQLAKDVYGQREVPFKLSSQGFGKRYCVKNQVQLKEYGLMTSQSAVRALPRYYKKLLDLKNTDISRVLEERAMLKELARYVSLMETAGSGSQELINIRKSIINKQREKNMVAKQNLRKRSL